MKIEKPFHKDTTVGDKCKGASSPPRKRRPSRRRTQTTKKSSPHGDCVRLQLRYFDVACDRGDLMRTFRSVEVCGRFVALMMRQGTKGRQLQQQTDQGSQSPASSQDSPSASQASASGRTKRTKRELKRQTRVRNQAKKIQSQWAEYCDAVALYRSIEEKQKELVCMCGSLFVTCGCRVHCKPSTVNANCDVGFQERADRHAAEQERRRLEVRVQWLQQPLNIFKSN